jgi:hypothetical protein
MDAPYLSVQLIDDFGRVTRRNYQMAEQIDLATYQTVAASFLGYLQAVTDLGCTRAELVLPSTLTPWAAEADSNIDVGATFTGSIVDKPYKRTSHKLPGITMSLVAGDGTVQITGAIETYLGEFTDGEDFLISDGEQVDSWLRGKLDK